MSAETPGAGEVHRVEVQMRFADTDALGHVNNGSFIVYAETGRLELLRPLDEGVRSLILAHLAIDFRRQVRFGERVVVESWVERIGTTSVTLGQRILAAGETAADVRSVVVSFDYDAQRPAPWTPPARATLERLRPGAAPAGTDATDGA